MMLMLCTRCQGNSINLAKSLSVDREAWPRLSFKNTLVNFSFCDNLVIGLQLGLVGRF